MYDEDISGTIETILSLTKNSLEQHQQPVNILIRTKSKSPISLKFPDHGLYSSVAAHQNSNRIAIMLNLLQTIQECLTSSTVKTNRDLFYSNVELYGKQVTVDRWINTIAQSLELTNARDNLNVIPAQKGLVFTTQEIRILTKGSEERINPYHSSLIPHMDQNSLCQIVPGRNATTRLLVLEKEAVYNQLVNDVQYSPSYYDDCIIVTGKGYPDFLTRLFLHKLQVSTTAIERWEIYTDADPYGVDIAMKYVQNVKEPCRCNKLVHRGVFLFQLMSNQRQQVQYLPMTQRDTAVATRILQRVTESNLPNMTTVQELQRQIFLQKKAEMNVMGRETYLGQK
ncbi:Spo11/DNA topoisomerase VI subunit A [Zygosaccharomyces rouxii]|nr:Spo11/DNA topoisomerase VI subunit A [Zygosaccharomyces rouxii]